MDSEDALLSSGLVKCCNCGCKCSSLTLSSSRVGQGTWIRSVKRKHDEFEECHFYVPGLDHLQVARVEIENECVALQEMVSSQENMIQELYKELDEERNASSSAANEAMSMILRLQREKAEVEMEARQFKRFAEEKMSHDAQEIATLEDLLYKRDQAIQSLTCEVQAYKHRMMSYGLTEAEAEGMKGGYSRNKRVCDFGGQAESPTCAYPSLKCNLNETQKRSDFGDDTLNFEKYPFGATPWTREHLRRLEFRINQLERTSSGNQLDGDFSGSRNILEKVIVGYSPRQSRHSRRFSTGSLNSFLTYSRGPDQCPDSPRLATSFKKMDCAVEELMKTDNASEFGDDMNDRVYTVDSVNHGASDKVALRICEDSMTTHWDSYNPTDMDEAEIKKLYLRLQALEADRESLKQTIILMQTDKAQLVLLREIAQQLCKDISAEKRMPPMKPFFLGTFSFTAVFKWAWSIIFWRKKAHQVKYTFGLSPNNVGLLMLLEKAPRARPWRCVTSTRV